MPASAEIHVNRGCHGSRGRPVEPRSGTVEPFVRLSRKQYIRSITSDQAVADCTLYNAPRNQTSHGLGRRAEPEPWTARGLVNVAGAHQNVAGAHLFTWPPTPRGGRPLVHVPEHLTWRGPTYSRGRPPHVPDHLTWRPPTYSRGRPPWPPTSRGGSPRIIHVAAHLTRRAPTSRVAAAHFTWRAPTYSRGGRPLIFVADAHFTWRPRTSRDRPLHVAGAHIFAWRAPTYFRGGRPLHVATAHFA
jgi:hypothetical protein